MIYLRVVVTKIKFDTTQTAPDINRHPMDVACCMGMIKFNLINLSRHCF